MNLRPLLLVAATLVLLSYLFAGRVTRAMPDLEVYWTAAVRARAAEPLYRVEDQHYQFKYLPAFAVLALPMGLVTLAQAKAIWFPVSVALLVVLLALCLRLLPERRKPAWLLVGAAIVTMGKFYGHELVLGQVNLLFGVIVVGALVALRSGREAPAGLLVALAVVVKPYAALFLPWLAARRQPGPAVAAASGLAAALALPVLFYGIDGSLALHRDWWRTVTGSTAPNLLNQDNVSVAAMYAKWLGPGWTAAWLATLTGAVLLAGAALTFLRRGRLPFPDGLEGALLLTLIPLLSPQGWDYVFLISTPAILYVVNYEDRLPAALRAASLLAIATVGLSLYDVMGRASYARFMALSVITLCFLVIVSALVSLRLRRAA
ncbi:MAG TPA: glycosyltransferase family 87 protein [Vicinamibacterales bacterium]|nr:glycosyltransferase family 87 protein [Vicinamibacterales bacterium]